SLPLLRGSQPTELLLVHRAGQQAIRNLPDIPLPPLPQLIATCEALAALASPQAAKPPRVKAIALNTGQLEGDAAELEIKKASQLTGLPCGDPVRGDRELLLAALLS
ncbi:MAG: DUF1611 domain-containing protein, partial [Synechococcaceae bacterium WB4_2_0811]|nr:DUF1611 domain-containing protein [Synechococcaceae bacterium WB4_2_0811]